MSDKFAVLQAQRDRFLAFSFAAADLLLEIDSVDGIAYASGATVKLLGRDVGDLQGSSFIEVIAPADRGLVQAAIKTMGGGMRLQTLNVALADGTTRAWVNGYRMPMADGRAYIAMSTQDRFIQRPTQDGRRNEQSGLLDGGAMGQALSRAVEAGQAGGAGDMLTLLEVDGLDKLGSRIAPAAYQSLISNSKWAFPAFFWSACGWFLSVALGNRVLAVSGLGPGPFRGLGPLGR